jgi:hypothetical protein
VRQKRTAPGRRRRTFRSSFFSSLRHSRISPTPPRLFLFSADLAIARRAERAGVDSVIVDWERHGKHARQQGHDTEINDHSVAAVSTLSSRLRIPVTVRANPLHALVRIAEAYDSGRASPAPTAAQALERLATTEPHMFDRLLAFLVRFLLGPALYRSIAHQRAVLDGFLPRWPASARRAARQRWGLLHRKSRAPVRRVCRDGGRGFSIVGGDAHSASPPR